MVIYGDFNCPFSAVASRRADRLVEAGRLRVDWRAVEHDPTIGPHETPLTPEQRAAFEHELVQIASLLGDDEPYVFRVPSRRLNTRDLNRVYVATPPPERAVVRSALFDAYWRDDRDLTAAAVIDEVVGNATQATGDVDGERAVTGWQTEWAGLPEPIVPAMVLENGYVSRGLGALARLASRSVAAPAPDRSAMPAGTGRAADLAGSG